MDPILIPPGSTQTWKCPEDSAPAVKKGDVLKSSDKDALYVVDVTPEGLVLGPLVAGDLEVSGLCQGQGAVVFRVEAPDPQKIDKSAKPLAPVELAYPWWLWVAIVLILAAVAALAWLVRRLWVHKPEGALAASRVRMRKSPSEKMQLFLSKIEAQQIVSKDDVASSQMLYGEGLTRMRSILQEAYGFKAPGATTTEFIAEVKAMALRKPSLLQPAQIAQLESVFMQAKQVTYAREIPETALRAGFHKSLRDLAEGVMAKISAASVAQAPAKRRNPFAKKKEGP
jgi:hypothetical protein